MQRTAPEPRKCSLTGNAIDLELITLDRRDSFVTISYYVLVTRRLGKEFFTNVENWHLSRQDRYHRAIRNPSRIDADVSNSLPLIGPWPQAGAPGVQSEASICDIETSTPHPRYCALPVRSFAGIATVKPAFPKPHGSVRLGFHFENPGVTRTPGDIDDGYWQGVPGRRPRCRHLLSQLSRRLLRAGTSRPPSINMSRFMPTSSPCFSSRKATPTVSRRR